MKYSNRSTSRIKRIANSPITLLFFVIFCFFLAKATFNVHRKASLTDTKLLQAQAEFAKLESRKDVLANKVSTLSTDEGIESEMRTKYRAVREGEFVAVIVDDKDKSAPTTTPPTESTSWWRRLLSFVGIGQ